MITTCPARHDDPDFVPSLRLLVERERYSLADIGLMFGVSRERVRQWCQRYQIEHPDPRGRRGLNCLRVWDDAHDRFVPVARGLIARERRKARGDAYRRSVVANRTAKWHRAVEVLIARREQLGRADLSQREMAEVIFPHRRIRKNEWGAHLQGLNKRLPITETVRRLRHDAGLAHRDTRGEHLRGVRKPYCRRGHPLSGENLYIWRGNRYCRACKNIRLRHPLPRPDHEGP